MKIKLPDVTLVMIETREHALARLAIEDCLAVAEFGDVLIMTDKPGLIVNGSMAGARVVTVEDWPDKEGWCRCWWHEMPQHIRTRQTLNIQWDSWICDASMWRPEFMDYDYVGSPWWYKDGKNVGNGGFSLKSTPFIRYIADRKAQFPVTTNACDNLFSRAYRPTLESVGFKWAPEKVAHDFAFECCRPSPTSKHFGFHAMFNWPKVLTPDRVKERLAIAMQSKYISNSSYMLKAFAEQNPDFVGLLKQGAKNYG